MASSANDDKVTGCLLQLIQNYVSSSKSIHEKDASNRAAALYNYSMRILSSRLSENSLKLENANAVADDLLYSFAARESSTQESIDQVSNLLSKLCASNALRNKGAVICFLKQLIDAGNRKHAKFVPSMVNTPSPTITLTPSTLKSTPAVSASTTLLKSQDSEELLWIRDLTFVFQGANSALVHYNQTTQMYTIAEEHSANLTPPQRELILRLAELGTLYKPVGQFVSRQLSLTNSGTLGHVAQAFVAAVQDCLSGYFRGVAALEGRLKSGGGLTLKKVWLWAQDPIQKMRMLHVLVKLSHGQRGGALVSMIHTYTNHGDPFVCQFNEKLLETLSKPYFRILSGWLSHGELNDPHEEAFIEEDSSQGPETLWKSRYGVRSSMMASFINKTTAKKMFLIGKNLNFAKICCKDDHEWLRSHMEWTVPKLSTLTYQSESLQLESLIEEIYVETSRHVLDLLYDRYELQAHFDALYRFFLLQQGDFVHYLMENLCAELDKPAESIYRHDLMSVLDSAIPATNAQYALPDSLKRLDLRLLESKNGDSGWNAFTLDYHVDSPLDTIFSSQVLQQYFKLFHYLWRIKRVEHAVITAWSVYQKLYSKCGLLSQQALAGFVQMVHFIKQLQTFMQYEVLESSWHEFVASIGKRNGDIDSLISAHNKYLNAVTSKAILASTAQPNALSGQLFQLFNLILEFTSAQTDALSTLSSLSNQSYGSTKTQRHNVTDSVQHLEKLSRDFQSSFQQFVQNLSQLNELHLKSLYLSLNYNQFFDN